MKWKIVGAIFVVLGLFISYSLFYAEDPTRFLYVFSIFSTIGISFFLLDIYLKHLEIKEIEERFPEFLSALAESLEAGMTLVQAFDHVSKTNFGKLTPYIKKMYYKMTWGIPFPKVLEDFSKQIPSKEIKRAIVILLESYLMGGDIVGTLESLSKSLKRLREIREDIKTTLGEQVKVIYAINFLFMVILIIMFLVAIPLQIQSPGEVAGLEVKIETQKYKQLFLVLGIMMGVCSGMMVGVVSEGSLKAGIKHSAILSLINLLVLGYLFLRKNIYVDIEMPSEIKVGKIYKIKGIVYVEGEPCNGYLIFQGKNISIVNGNFEFETSFMEKGEREVLFKFYCNGEEFERRERIVVD